MTEAKKHPGGTDCVKPKVNTFILTWLLAACSMIGPFATDMYLPSLHEMTQVFGVPMQAVQQTLSAYLIGFAAMTLFYGTISDILGRKTTMVAGFFFFMLASVGAAFSTTLAEVTFFRFVQGLFAGCGMVIGMAVIRDLFGGPQAQKLMAYVAMVFGFGPALAPVIGGYAATHFGWQSHFYTLAVISAFLCLACVFFLPESLPKSARTPVNFKLLAVNYAKAAANPAFMTGCSALGLAFLGQGVFIAGAADWCVNVMGMKPDEFWHMFLPMIAGTVIGSWISARTAQKIGTPMTIRVSFAIMALGALAALFEIVFVDQPEMPWAVLPLAVYTTGIGMMRPAMSLLLMDFYPHSRGMASSVLNFLQTLFFALCSAFIVPFLYGDGAKYSAAIIVFSLLTMLFWAASTQLYLRSKHRAALKERSDEIG